MIRHPRLWFRPKYIGFGYSPASWEGWLVTALAMLAVVGLRFLFRH